MSDTPRTDKESKTNSFFDPERPHDWVALSFARQLEREVTELKWELLNRSNKLDAAQAEINQLKQKHAEMSPAENDREAFLKKAAQQQSEAVSTGRVTIKGIAYPLHALFRCYFCGEYLTFSQAREHFGSREENKEKYQLERENAQLRKLIELITGRLTTHRADSMICCDEKCFCWEIAELLESAEEGSAA